MYKGTGMVFKLVLKASLSRAEMGRNRSPCVLPLRCLFPNLIQKVPNVLFPDCTCQLSRKQLVDLTFITRAFLNVYFVASMEVVLAPTCVST